MATKHERPSYVVRPPTAILTRGFDPALSLGSARPAVFRASTYVFPTPEAAERAFAIALGKTQAAPGENVDLIYSRLSHPNAEILEDQIVPLEPRAEAAAVFNSGMAAISTVLLSLCPPDTAFLYTTPLYGGTYHLIHEILQPLSIRGVAIPAGDTDGLMHVIQTTQPLRIVFLETPANPTLRMSDIGAAVQAAKEHPDRPLVVVDNTFLGPAFQHPLTLGADLVVYSATKFLAGYSDMLGGVVLGHDPNLIAHLRGTRAILGNILQPDECWLLGSRLPMVTHRMNRQSKNAQRIAESLVMHSKIERLIYPSLFTDPEQIRIRDAQAKFPGAVFSVVVKGGKPAAFDLLRNLRIFRNAVSLGGVESLACHPASTTHSEMPEQVLRENGIADGMVRFSVGVEHWRDLCDDVHQALDSV